MRVVPEDGVLRRRRAEANRKRGARRNFKTIF